MKLQPLVTILVITVLFNTSCINAEATDYTKLFQKDGIMDIFIEIDESDFQDMLDNAQLEEYKSATVTIGGETIQNVGIRTKGNSSLNSLVNSDSDRYSFRIKFDKYVEGQTLSGLDELVINNIFSDPSYMREYLSYEALTAIGSKSPLTSYANIYINDELFGFYLCIEALDNSYLERVFGDDTGNLYKQEMGSSLVYEEGSDYPTCELKEGNDTEKSGLKNFIRILNEMPDGEKGEIESVLDVDSALQYIAANTILCNYDSYNGSMLQNYYLYELNGKFTVIPWDYNLSFGGYMGNSTAYETIPIDEPVFGVSMDQTPLITNLLEVPEYKQRYYDYVEQLLAYLDGFEERVTKLAEIIRPYVEADPSKFVTMEQFESSLVYQQTDESMQNHNGNPSNQSDSKAIFPEDGNSPPLPEESSPALPPSEGIQRPKPQDNGPNEDGMPPNSQNRGPGGMMMGSAESIVTIAVNRSENVKKQLAGELPTTGNTTINHSHGGTENFSDAHTKNSLSQSDQITVSIDGEEVAFDQAPVIESGRVLVPVRAIFEALGASVEWSGDSATAVAVKDGTSILLTENDTTAYVNNISRMLDVPAKKYHDNLFVPVRFIAENLNMQVEWDENANSVHIISS